MEISSKLEAIRFKFVLLFFLGLDSIAVFKDEGEDDDENEAPAIADYFLQTRSHVAIWRSPC